MCGRISLFADVQTIVERFDVELDDSLRPRYNVAPSDTLATITNERPEAVSPLEWGLVPAWASAPEDGPRPINARRESIADAAPFRDAFTDRRCLVLVDGYYEWQETQRGRQPYRFERRDRSPFALAGLWDRWKSEQRTIETVAIVTTDAHNSVSDIHDRMPVILDEDRDREWLNKPPDTSDDSLLDPTWDDTFHHYPVSKRVNDPKHDDPSVIVPSDVDDQPTLSDF